MRISSAFQFTKHGDGERDGATWRFGNSRLSSVVQPLNPPPHFLSGVDSGAQKNARDEHTPNTPALIYLRTPRI